MAEDTQHREMDGPSTNIALSDMISNALPSDGKKDKLDLNNVNKSIFLVRSVDSYLSHWSMMCIGIPMLFRFWFHLIASKMINGIIKILFQFSLQSLQNGSSESCESASTSSIGSNHSHNNTSKAPGAQLQHKNNLFTQTLTNNNGNGNKNSISGAASNSTLTGFPDFTTDLSKQVLHRLQ